MRTCLKMNNPLLLFLGSHEESYDYYYGPRQREGDPSGKGKGRKRRIAPPPPPGFEDDPPSPPPSKKRIAPPPPTDFSSEGDSGCNL